MTTTVEAIYEDGVLKLPRRLPLPEKAHVKVTIETAPPAARTLKGALG
jgi:predicted DNA-binding antitoxin AbrB/MazE fold protein